MTDPLDQLMQRIRADGFGCLLRDEGGREGGWFAGIYARCWGSGNDCLAEGHGDTPLLAMKAAVERLRQSPADHRAAQRGKQDQQQLRLV